MDIGIKLRYTYNMELPANLLIAIPAITGLVQAFKNAGIPSKYAPFVAVVLGVLFSLPENPTVEGALIGILMGLSSVGLYDLPKMAKKNVDKQVTQ